MAVDFKFPDVGEGITEGEIVKWYVKEGDLVNQDDVVLEVETDKAIAEIPSPAAGKITKIYHREGETVKVGESLFTIDSGAEQPVEKPLKKTTSAIPIPESEQVIIEQKTSAKKTELKTEEPLLAAPATRRLAKELGVDLRKVRGTGPLNRITENDVRNFQTMPEAEGKEEVPSETKPSLEIRILKKYDIYGPIERVSLRGIRKTTAKRMTQSHTNAVHVTHMDDADITELFRIREIEKKSAEEKGIHLTFLPFIIKAVIEGLKEHPYLNSMLDEENGEIILKKYYNIGIAMDVEDGLIVPVIKIADQKSIFDLANEIQELSKKAQERKLDLADMKGGTFTMTNVGTLGGTYATPMINYPEVAILATGRIQDRVVVKDEKIQKRKILPLSLTFDHRVLDGAEAARFMNAVIMHLENPEEIL